jgi:hypothetical protein
MATISRNFQPPTLQADGSVRVDGTTLEQPTPQSEGKPADADPADQLFVTLIRTLPDKPEEQYLQEAVVPAGGTWPVTFSAVDPPFETGQTVRLIGLAVGGGPPFFWEETATLELK